MVLRVAGWLVGCLFFCVDLVDGAQQCNVLQVISGDIDGIIHRHSSVERGSGVGSFGSFRVTCNRLLYQVIEVFTKSM